jgi:thioredoxin-like negative regulator of GroEL
LTRAAVATRPGRITQAKAASQVSHRPVLILFVASWFEKSINHDTTFLASEEAVALLTACFEPVRVDIEADPATPKRLGVSNIPSACVVDADERVLSRFDCPETSAGFVAAAGRAADGAVRHAAGAAAARCELRHRRIRRAGAVDVDAPVRPQLSRGAGDCAPGHDAEFGH